MTDHSAGLVLVVGDDLANIEILAEILESEYEIAFASGGQRAIAVANGPRPPDIVLLDVEMPDMNGYEVCVRLKQERATSDIPVIFITGCNDVDAEARGLAVGAVDYITKPIAPVLIKMRVRTRRWPSSLTRTNGSMSRSSKGGIGFTPSTAFRQRPRMSASVGRHARARPGHPRGAANPALERRAGVDARIKSGHDGFENTAVVSGRCLRLSWGNLHRVKPGSGRGRCRLPSTGTGWCGCGTVWMSLVWLTISHFSIEVRGIFHALAGSQENGRLLTMCQTFRSPV